MKNKKCNIVGAIPKFNRQIVEAEGKSIPLTYIYMTSYIHIHDL
jgi:hypothetical protein